MGKFKILAEFWGFLKERKKWWLASMQAINPVRGLENIFTLFLGILISFLMLEVFLRVYDPFQFRVQGIKILLPANRQYRIKNDKWNKVDKTIIHTKNSLGFRGEEPPRDFKNHLTIIAVGGSTTECFYLSDNKTWSYMLGEKLKTQFRNTWINNAGLDGHSTFGHIILLKDHILKIKPRIILFLVGWNDLGIEGIGDYEEMTMKLDTTSKNSLKRLIYLSANYSKVSSTIINMCRFYKAKQQDMVHTEIDLKNMEKLELSQDKKDILKRRHKDKYIELYRVRLKMLIQLCRESDIEPIFITQPALVGKGADDITGVNLARLKILDMDGELYWDILEMYNDVVRDIGNQLRVFVIDLARSMPKSSRYYYDGGHFTNEGACEVTKIIFDELYPFLTEKYPSFFINKNK